MYNTIMDILMVYRGFVLDQKSKPECNSQNILKSINNSDLPQDIENIENSNDSKIDNNHDSKITSKSTNKIPPNEQAIASSTILSNQSSDDQIKDDTQTVQPVMAENATSNSVKNDVPVNINTDDIYNEKIAAEDNQVDRILVRALDDLKPFVGIDKIVYELHREDIATIPKINAEILRKNKKVNFIDVDL
jgi:hypothetical protein